MNSLSYITDECHHVRDDSGDAGHDERSRDTFSRDVTERQTDFFFIFDEEGIVVITADRLGRVV